MQGEVALQALQRRSQQAEHQRGRTRRAGLARQQRGDGERRTLRVAQQERIRHRVAELLRAAFYVVGKARRRVEDVPGEAPQVWVVLAA